MGENVPAYLSLYLSVTFIESEGKEQHSKMKFVGYLQAFFESSSPQIFIYSSSAIARHYERSWTPKTIISNPTRSIYVFCS